MTLTPEQETALDHIRSAYVGPEGGPLEVIYNGRPDLQYSVGMLYPPDSSSIRAGDEPGADEDSIDADVPSGEVDDKDARFSIAEDWRPSSVAISFITDGHFVLCDFDGGTYAPLDVDGPPQWQRTPFRFLGLRLSPTDPPHRLHAADVQLEVGSRWRKVGQTHLVTVHARVTTPAVGEARLDAVNALYQVGLAVEASPGSRILEYDTRSDIDTDGEAAELRLRYRERKTYAVGHGMAADWEKIDGECHRVFLDPVPHFVVPAVETVAFDEHTAEAQALELDFLSRIDTETADVVEALEAFVNRFDVWIANQQDRVEGFNDASDTANKIVDRSRQAMTRMRAAVAMLADPDSARLRTAFSLGMVAMSLQMSRDNAITPEERRSKPAPSWRPFQLGFILVALASTVDGHHDDRELVDLIWFPTGGGKTEAYLGLAAIEMFNRRLQHGVAGGGTAVITRYTLRLLTAQQFHRAASLICAMELLRRPEEVADPRARGMAPFSIGLWVGNEVTPGTRSEARRALERLHKAARPEEANQFQIESCPWCNTDLLPSKVSRNHDDYGFRLVGRDVVVHCTSAECPFSDELPVLVVDEVLYDAPPTFLLATVDKFARLQFKSESGRLLGLETPFKQPSLVIQDELHLLSGPLGTTVAVFDSVLQLLLSRGGSVPKMVASTATIRASLDQVQGLYGRAVALYPPSGLDDDRNFFARPVASGEGRLYVGFMPQSASQASAVIAAAAPLLELPEVVATNQGASRDDYWTAVMYHNSLRELGRTGTLVADDVNARLEARAERLDLTFRRIRPDRVLELTSRRGPEDLPRDLRELGRSVETTDQAIDVVLSSNMLSVGIDVPRLALMLMVGQPKTTAEYIQATSRVGRGRVRGVVVTLFRSNRARDRSHFETFRSFHESLYRTVEPTSVTPWSVASRQRSLAGALVALLRHSFAELADNQSAVNLDLGRLELASSVATVVDQFLERVARADSSELDETRDQVWSLLRDWDRRADLARGEGSALPYGPVHGDEPALLKRFGQVREGWLVADSMRSVDPNVAVEVREPMDGGI